ncbi:TetR/AcrR family transcriptional regulator [Microlunatus speluncae]|uniref:TetR/AcrR family transcriptional regulator n=1 Tax=Microlunatus speluncae TaxID=2594267 RepID=UPI001266470F|nr:TetR/AcrR family transcriptional regulator [Microlunatus speluncae]
MNAEARSGRGLGSAYEQRRREIVDAVVEVAGSGGLEAVNVRDIADRAGVSLGRVQHYFPSKTDLMAAAFDQVSRAATGRIQQRLADDPALRNPVATLGLIVEELIPDGPERRTELAVAFAFTARALVDPELAARLRQGYAELRALVARLLAEGVAAGLFVLRATPEAEADRCLALVEGLGVYVLLGHRTAAEARRLALEALTPDWLRVHETPTRHLRGPFGGVSQRR